MSEVGPFWQGYQRLLDLFAADAPRAFDAASGLVATYPAQRDIVANLLSAQLSSPQRVRKLAEQGLLEVVASACLAVDPSLAVELFVARGIVGGDWLELPRLDPATPKILPPRRRYLH